MSNLQGQRPRARTHVTLVTAVLVALALVGCDREQPTTVDPPVVVATGEAAAPADVDALRARVELVDQRLEAAQAALADLAGQVEGDTAPLVVAEDELTEARALLDEVFDGLVPTATPTPAVPLDPPTTP